MANNKEEKQAVASEEVEVKEVGAKEVGAKEVEVKEIIRSSGKTKKSTKKAEAKSTSKKTKADANTKKRSKKNKAADASAEKATEITSKGTDEIAVKAVAKAKAKKKKLKVLFAASEATPFITTGGMGQVIGSLPKSIKKIDRNVEVCVVTPFYEQIKQKFASSLEYVGNAYVQLAWRSLYCGVFKTEVSGITYYFIDNEYYFKRDGCYNHYDDGERFAFFSKAVFAMMEITNYKPDIIHTHDWQTALVPVYMKAYYYEQYPDTKVIFTIHNIEYQGQYDLGILTDVFDLADYHGGLLEYEGCINLMKAAIIACDKLTTVSPTYANEIRVDKGFNLEPIIRQNEYKLVGILNGIDVHEYDPMNNKLPIKNFSADSLDGKQVNKLELQKLFDLEINPRKMLLCVVSRLTSLKGIDFITYTIDEILKMDVQLIMLGTGAKYYELFFSELAVSYPDKVGVNTSFNPELAYKIYAGSDMLLMPSKSEPCGLAQMIASRFGTIPLVGDTGGLKDTVKDCRLGEGNGFVFTEMGAGRMLDTLRQAVDLYAYNKADWENLMKHAMSLDFSWESSAAKYLEMYRGLF